MSTQNGTPGVAAKRPAPLRYLPRLLLSVVQANPAAAISLTVLTVIVGGLPAVQFAVLGRLIGQLETVEGLGLAAWESVVPHIAFLAGIILLATLLQMVSPILEMALREAMGIRIQKEVIEKAQSLELAYFEHPEFYDSLQRANQDMGGRLVNLMRVSLDALGALVSIGSLLVLLITAHWSLVPIVVIGAIPRVWVALKMNRRTYWVYRVRTPENRMAIYIRGLLTRRDGAKEVRLFTLSRHLMQQWTELASRLAIERRGLEVKQATWGGGAEGVAALAYGLCLAILASLISLKRLTTAQFITVTPAIVDLMNHIEALMRSGASLQEQSLYLGDLYEFLTLEPRAALTDRDECPGDQTELPLITVGDEPLGEITFEEVSFSYPGSDKFVLDNITLTLRPGERIAFVGENGAGKSTFVRLLLGLYEPTRGRILMGGRDLRTLPPDYVRGRMSAVFQDFVQYLFTVHDNIAFGRLSKVGAYEVERAAQMAGIAPFLEGLPKGYQTQLGREMDGVDFSGGEWQKLAIARALAREGEVIILDEPTAALDPISEAEIYQQFYDMTRGKTSVLISHRLGSARMANRIVVLKQGRIVEEGDHNTLVAMDGEYSRLFRLQAQWYA